MIKWFGKSLVTQLISIIVVAILLWGRAFAHPVEMVAPMGFVPLYELCYSIFHSLPLLASAVGLLLVLLTGYLFNELLYNNKLIPQGNWMPLFLFMIAVSYDQQMLTLHPFHLANIVILLGIRQTMLHSAKLTLPTGNLAAIMSCLIIASLCYNPYIVLLTTLFFIIPAYKAYNWKDISAIVLGLLAPLIPVVAIYWMTGNIETMMSSLSQNFTNFLIGWAPNDWMGWIMSGLFLAILFPAVTYLSNHRSEKPINLRKNIAAINHPTICSVLMLPWVGLMPLCSVIFAFGFGYLGYAFLNHNRNSNVWNIIFLLWIIATVVHLYIA